MIWTHWFKKKSICIGDNNLFSEQWVPVMILHIRSTQIYLVSLVSTSNITFSIEKVAFCVSSFLLFRCKLLKKLCIILPSLVKIGQVKKMRMKFYMIPRAKTKKKIIWAVSTGEVKKLLIFISKWIFKWHFKNKIQNKELCLYKDLTRIKWMKDWLYGTISILFSCFWQMVYNLYFAYGFFACQAEWCTTCLTSQV